MHRSAITSLFFVAGHYQIAVDPAKVIAEDLPVTDGPCTVDDIMLAAQRLGLKTSHQTNQSRERLDTVPLPALLRKTDGSYFVAVGRMGDGLRLFDPSSLIPIVDIAKDAPIEGWSGEIILMAPRVTTTFSQAVFDFNWFLRATWRYRWPLAQVLFASCIVQIFALATPLLFQVVIDKVLIHKGVSTLIVVIAGLIGIGIFEVVLSYLRSYALAHTTSRIDAELGAKVFDHMLKLPVSYFETRAAGQTVARVRELETIRSFITGQGLTSVIDVVFSVIFFAVMMTYSPLLTLVVLLSIPLYLGVTFVIRPLLKDRVQERFETGAASQQLLVESVVGIQTIKSGAVESSLRRMWENRLAAYIRSSFQAGTLSNIGQNAFQLIGKITTAAVLFLGANAVIQGDLTVGALVAFNMIMGQVTNPILRLSQVWQDLQQVMMSVDRVGDILRSPTEDSGVVRPAMPPVKGDVSFKDVSFRYSNESENILDGVTLDVAAGEVIGIVGPSGSGKSTLTKLIQRLYRPTSGRVLVDGIDICHVDASSLRRQIGVVLQDNLLFNRSLHDNIALSDPSMSRGQVIQLARLAGADEFISKLPRGYDTIIEERGANLSGGQRRRIAIARALASNPRILVLDEATSALDYESERLIQNNMRMICEGRTVFIIAHRLAAVRHCDRIIVVDEGKIVEQGNHNTLKTQDGFYSRLLTAQVQS
jgi:subfamily B ATP-binding cassette protein HlyB/CyaB